MYISLHVYPFELVIFLWIPCFFSRVFFSLAVSGGGTIDLDAFKRKCKNWSPFNSSPTTITTTNTTTTITPYYYSKYDYNIW